MHDMLAATNRNFTTALVRKAAVTKRALCVDPFIGMLNKCPPSLDTLQLDAVSFALDASQRSVFVNTDHKFTYCCHSYDRALMKEVVHHVDLADISRMCKGLYSQFNAEGRFLLITRPSKEVLPVPQSLHFV
jgi:hypothetical protein